MKPPSRPLTPKLDRKAQALGERLALVRRRRRITAEEAAARAMISRKTLSRLESGAASVGIDTLLRLLIAYGLDGDIDLIAADDQLGRDLQDAEISTPRRVRRG